MISRRPMVVGAVFCAASLGMAACSTGGDAPSGESGGSASVTLWDGFTQYDTGSSPYEKLIALCQEETGIKIERTVADNHTDKFTQAASTGDTPDVVVLDNPTIAQFAETGVLVDNATSGVDTSAMQPNIMASGEYDGKTYGASIGANTLALYYNADLLEAAGVQPPTNWDELKAAAEKLTDSAAGQYGLAFSARPDQEGSFQFLPFFWGAGADLTDVSSPEAVEALELWTSLVADGYASSENVTLNQQEIRDQFMAGRAAMMVNGTWQLNTLDESGINYAVVPIPAKDGGEAPSPLGGEFLQIVNNGKPEAIESAGKVVECMIEPENLSEFLTGQTYISPYADQAKAQAEADPRLEPWVEAVAAAKSRSEELGSHFAIVATNLGEALSGAVAGQESPQQALERAQQASE